MTFESIAPCQIFWSAASQFQESGKPEGSVLVWFHGGHNSRLRIQVCMMEKMDFRVR